MTAGKGILSLNRGSGNVRVNHSRLRIEVREKGSFLPWTRDAEFPPFKPLTVERLTLNVLHLHTEGIGKQSDLYKDRAIQILLNNTLLQMKALIIQASTTIV